MARIPSSGSDELLNTRQARRHRRLSYFSQGHLFVYSLSLVYIHPHSQENSDILARISLIILSCTPASVFLSRSRASR
ncbi:hypothetical protein A0H81_01912 [Grifola frondosa]|uniref:Uncharacterized protein n=1 Tax=Grifola frondosa TaxID=5627 RepID=A0A1C7MM63_GRIFR|nr:hypothetical protein A0H81_01912 [Grifola frondosa]